MLFAYACAESKQAIADMGKLSVCLTGVEFAAAHVLNKEGVAQFVHERSVIAALNHRLGGLIDVVRHMKIFPLIHTLGSAGK